MIRPISLPRPTARRVDARRYDWLHSLPVSLEVGGVVRATNSEHDLVNYANER